MAQRRRNIEFAAPDEPTFLKKMKAEIGYQKRDTIETKKKRLENEDLVDHEDEQPVFIVSEGSNITDTELNQLKDKLKEESDQPKSNHDDDSVPEKIYFRKPTKDKDPYMKDTQNKSMKTTQSSLKSKKLEEAEERNRVMKSKIKSVKNANLLSFNDDDDEN
ncbi:hypothetical protein RDWZM_006849 [Blomia tropicalis]|uniref:DUF4604 domain-containing protein n=1 Tax=Blomia tropicalis TaxID=40697 RepID=A0A9Q0MAJ2_BLOTA|nr:hypothetical protein BLOT_013166 [Blomia tropicalis]KAJ6221037.1 hypothetical protein RDWZM_006849 [Blomia tropicalis]